MKKTTPYWIGHKLTLSDAKKICKQYGHRLTKCDGEYRINHFGASEATAYYTNDLEDAVNTAHAQALRLVK